MANDLKSGGDSVDSIMGGAIIATKLYLGTEIIWENVKWTMDMIITDVQTADVYDFEHIFPDETDGTTILKGISTDIAHQPFQAKYEFANISNAIDPNILITNCPITDGDNLVIVLDDNSVHEVVASGVSGDNPYTMNTNSITNGEIPLRVFAVDIKLSFAISSGYQNAITFSDDYSYEFSPADSGEETFTSNGNYIAKSNNATLCMIGGGGGGGMGSSPTYGAGGGHAGTIKSETVEVVKGTTYPISCGSGGLGAGGLGSGISGNPSSALGIVANGGIGGNIYTLVGQSASYAGHGQSRTTCYGTANDGAYEAEGWGGQAGFGNGGQAGIDGLLGAGGGGGVHSSASAGGRGMVKISFDIPEVNLLKTTRKYKNLIDSAGSVTISPKVLLKSIGDKTIELRGSILE